MTDDIPDPQVFRSAASRNREQSNEYLLAQHLQLNKPSLFIRTLTYPLGELHSGDLLLIDREIKPIAGDIVAIEWHGNILYRFLHRLGDDWLCVTGNPIDLSIPMEEEMWWGTVVAFIRRRRKRKRLF